MDEILYTTTEIKLEDYEQKIKHLIDLLLEIDEKNYSNQCSLEETEVVA